MEYDWTIFLNEDFHPTFRKALSKQLFEKGEVATGIKDFKNLNLQLIIGITELDIKLVDDKVYAKIDFITPSSFSTPIEINWTTGDSPNPLEVHKNDISKMNIDINWGKEFPLQEIAPYMQDEEFE